MKRKHTVQLVIETEEILVVRSSVSRGLLCFRCAGKLINEKQAMVVAGVSLPALRELTKTGLVHLDESGGSILVCLTSLLSHAR